MATATTTRRKAAATKRSTAAKKAAQTRAANQAATARKRSAAAKKAAQTRRELEKTAFDRAREYAEKGVLVPLGAALIARDNVVSTVEGLRTSYSTSTSAQRELRRFERRGTTARNRVERELRRTRTRVERELRQRRTQAERRLKQRRNQFDLVGARVENAVWGGLSTATRVSADVQKKVLNLGA